MFGSAKVAFDKIVELAVPFADLKLAAGDAAEFYIEARREGELVQRAPEVQNISFTAPSRDFDMIMWDA